MTDDAAALLDPHKKDILACLHRAYDRGPKRRPFNDDMAWGALSAFGRRWCNRSYLIEQPLQRQDRAGKIAAVAHELCGLLEDVVCEQPTGIRSATGDDLLSALARDFPSDGAAWGRAWQELEQIIGGIAAIETAANEVVEANRRSQGRQRGSGKLPPEYVQHLAVIFSTVTETKPTTTATGPFVTFVRAVCRALGIELKSGLVLVVKTALQQLKAG